MPSPSNLPLSFNRDRAVRQLDARLEELLEKLRKNRPSEDPWMVRRAYEIATERHHDQLRSLPVLAAYLPARSASRIGPMPVLRISLSRSSRMRTFS